MKTLFALLGLIALVTLAPTRAHAQTHTHDPAQAVRATIDRMFDGMRAGDSTAVRSVFHPSARLLRAVGPASDDGLRDTPLNRFLTAVGTPHDAVWDERLFDVVIQVNGDLASAWTPYVFFLGDKLSHCGVNTFQLVRLADAGWKVVSLADTAQPDCSHVPQDVMNP